MHDLVVGDVSENLNTLAKLAGAISGLDFLTTEDFSDQLLDSNGYQKLPGGLMLQWGVFNSTGSGSGTFTVSFPVPFYDGNNHVSITGNNWNPQGYGHTGLISVSSTNFVFLRGSNQNTIGSHWFALGRYK